MEIIVPSPLRNEELIRLTLVKIRKSNPFSTIFCTGRVKKNGPSGKKILKTDVDIIFEN